MLAAFAMKGKPTPTHEPLGIRRGAVWLAWLLDSSIPLPGIRFRIGLDPLLGLVPGLGDALGAVLSGYLIREAARLGAPRSVLMRMAFNVAVDAVFGLVPIAGNVFDAVWKANRRNLALLERHLADPRRTAASSTLFVGLILSLLLLFSAGLVVVGFLIMRELWRAIA